MEDLLKALKKAAERESQLIDSVIFQAQTFNDAINELKRHHIQLTDEVTERVREKFPVSDICNEQ